MLHNNTVMILNNTSTPIRDGIQELRARANMRIADMFSGRGNNIQQSREKDATEKSQNPKENFDSEKIKSNSAEKDPKVDEPEN